MSLKSPDTTAETDESKETLEEKYQETLSKLHDTEVKLTNLNQELTAVRKDFEEYKATNDAKLEGLEQKMAQMALGLGAGAPNPGSLDDFDMASFGSEAGEAKELPGSQKPSDAAPQPQDPLTLKIASLEAALLFKTSQISRMEQEHEETVRLMSEQLDNVYERLRPESQPIGPQEVQDARFEILEERNKELQSIIQANLIEIEMSKAKEEDARAILLAQNADLQLRLDTRESDYDFVLKQFKQAKEEIGDLKAQLRAETKARTAYFKEVTKLRESVGSQAEELKDDAKAPDIQE